jgi:hypothetical protein
VLLLLRRPMLLLVMLLVGLVMPVNSMPVSGVVVVAVPGGRLLPASLLCLLGIHSRGWQ